MPRVDSSKSVLSLGVGRADYSQSVEQSVEPVVTSWQQDYNDYETFTITAGSSTSQEVTVTADYVIMLYDFYLSSSEANVLELAIDMLSAAGNWVVVARKSATQYIDINLSKGFAFFKKFRIRAWNYGGTDAPCYFSAHGIITTETQYFGGIYAGP